MRIWVIEPRDPFIARDGKPFGAIPGARASSLPFPFPSTTTGGVRTRAGLNANGIFTASPEDSRTIEVAGPFLVELNQTGEIAEWLVPAPADALLFETNRKDDRTARCKQLVPQVVPADCLTDLDGEGLAVMQFAVPEREASKPAQQLRFWHWSAFAEWLEKPQGESLVTYTELGHNGPQVEARTHVKLNPETLTAAESQLFQTQGLEFTHNKVVVENSSAQKKSIFQSVTDDDKQAQPQHHTQADSLKRTMARLALAVITPAGLNPGLAPLGGERRLVMWRQNQGIHLPDSCPAAIRETICATQRCRVVLATPGFFEKGFRPTWLCSERAGVTPKLTAIACQRYQTVSGWDFETGTAKPSHRLAPGGSVYFLSLETSDQVKINNWIDATWLRTVSDNEQWRRDGFGVALLGTGFA